MKKPVFLDETGRRWIKIKIFILTLCIAVLIFELMIYKDWNASLIQSIQTNFFYVLKNIVLVYLISAITIGFLRLLILMYFSRRQWKRSQKLQEQEEANMKLLDRLIAYFPYKNSSKTQQEIARELRKCLGIYRPTVSVVIPVYNEEAVINKTVAAILQSRYPVTEILVIDDGSTDQTAAIVMKAFSNSSIVKLIIKENGGKSSALNLGFRKANSDIVVTIDADTVFTKNTIAHLVTHFKDPEVAAVAGNCKTGNIRNQLTIWQHIEYVTANNLDRRACEELNCMMVVPGSNSAWRKSVVKDVGYFDHDTLAEDTDLTIKVLNAGHKVKFDDRALSYEECPENIKDFLKQRFRWSYGILQSLYKHRRSILTSKNRVIKYYSASMIFSYILHLTVPLVDILFIVALLSGSKSIFLFALFFYVTDVLAPAYSFWLEREKMKPLLWIVIQRIAYRYLIAFVTWKTIIIALKGSNVGWNKFERSGNNSFPS
ncbi:MAG: glycosyltransferase [Bacillus sp. (in: firmicutes)]